MRKKHIIVGLAVLCAVLALTIFWLTSPPTKMLTPAVVFVGYTNSSTGSTQAVFTITNRATRPPLSFHLKRALHRAD